MATIGLEVFDGEVAVDGDRVWDYDVDSNRIEGRLYNEDGRWFVHWDEDPENFDFIVLNPLQLHKITIQNGQS